MDEIAAWRLEAPDTLRNLADDVRNYFIPDFTQWRQEAAFERTVDRLVDDLRKAHDEDREEVLPAD